MHVVFVGIASKVRVITFYASVKFTDVGRVVGRTIKLKHDYREFVVCFSLSTEFEYLKTTQNISSPKRFYTRKMTTLVNF